MEQYIYVCTLPIDKYNVGNKTNHQQREKYIPRHSSTHRRSITRRRKRRQNHAIATLGFFMLIAIFLATAISVFTAGPVEGDTIKLSQHHTEMEEVADPLDATILVDESVTIPEDPAPVFKKFSLPNSIYGDNLDFSYFQPYMDYRMITDSTSDAYAVVNNDAMFIDENGMCRYVVPDDAFSINGKADYVIALGTYYKPKGVVGTRYLIQTTTGAYTAITGDEKSDAHTDDHHMFVLHGDDNQWAGVIEFLVQTDKLNSTIRRAGTVTVGPDVALQGEILSISLIVE